MYDELILTDKAYSDQDFNEEHNLGQKAGILLKLTEPFRRKVYREFTDNYYSSVALISFQLGNMY